VERLSSNWCSCVLVPIWILIIVIVLSNIIMGKRFRKFKSILGQFINIAEFSIYEDSFFLHDYIETSAHEKINITLFSKGQNHRFFLVDTDLRLQSKKKMYHHSYSYSCFTHFIVETPTRVPGNLVIAENKSNDLMMFQKFISEKNKDNIIQFEKENFFAMTEDIPGEVLDGILKPELISLLYSAGKKFSIEEEMDSVIVTRDFIILTYPRIMETKMLWNVISFGKHLAGFFEQADQ
jgi:hypothetical protein